MAATSSSGDIDLFALRDAEKPELELTELSKTGATVERAAGEPEPSLSIQTASNANFRIDDDEEEGESSPLILSQSDKKVASGAVNGALEKGIGTEKKGSAAMSWGQYIRRSNYEIFLGSQLSFLCPFILIALFSVQWGMSRGWIFMFSLLGIAPMAERLGFITEQFALFTGPTLGGLLNATFGNATELIISIFALRSHLIRVVQMSLLGSILSNMLLVLGCAFFAGGIRFREQSFNKTAALVNSGMLLMAVMCLASPAVLHATHTELHDKDSVLSLSRFSSVIMLLAYGIYIYFQLVTHVHLYDDSENDKEGDEEEEEEEEVLGFWGAIFWMAAVTLIISVLSEYLVDAIEGAADDWDIPVAFLSVIILPIVGNAAEHASAIMFAAKDKLDISLGVAIGSSTQIAMFAIPFCVVVGWCMGIPMDLDFHLFETAVLFMTVLVVAALLQEGESNYYKGVVLVFCYLIVGASFFVHNDIEEDLAEAKSLTFAAMAPAGTP